MAADFLLRRGTPAEPDLDSDARYEGSDMSMPVDSNGSSTCCAD
ncbi:MAG: hypothetical protein ABSB09_05640 [Acidimicrobiales bacterium]|jgi:hypothetical protein